MRPTATLALLLLLLLLLNLTQAHADSARPFWTEKTSYDEGERVYFVGVGISKSGDEDKARLLSALAARSETSRWRTW